MDAIALLRTQLSSAHTWCENTLGPADGEALHSIPPGKANPAAVAYAHAVSSEDFTINGWLRGAAPLLAAEWSGKTGMSEPMPQGAAYFDWTRAVQVDIPKVREYAQAVYAASDAYLASLTEADLDRTIDVPGIGPQTLAWILSQWVIGHVHDETGEISAIKGVNGMTGYAEG
jgi:DinB family protein